METLKLFDIICQDTNRVRQYEINKIDIKNPLLSINKTSSSTDILSNYDFASNDKFCLYPPSLIFYFRQSKDIPTEEKILINKCLSESLIDCGGLNTSFHDLLIMSIGNIYDLKNHHILNILRTKIKETTPTGNFYRKHNVWFYECN